MLDTTEKFCKDRAVHNAVLDGIKILDGKSKNKTPEAIPSILADALAVSFDKHIGHDYIEDADDRFKFYHTKEKKYQFDLSYFNRITKGGVPSKTLNIALAGTGVGKSLFMCHSASAYLAQGLNVLYITLEMAEERIGENIVSRSRTILCIVHAASKSSSYSLVLAISSQWLGNIPVPKFFIDWAAV